MQQGFAESGDDAIAPDISSFNLVIKSWGQGTARGFEHRAQVIFDEIIKLEQEHESSPEVNNVPIRPNDETFNAILSCWLKSKDNGSLNQVTMHLETMEKMFQDGNRDAKPDRVTMNSAMTALCRSGELDRAVQLQNRMEEVYRIVPDTVSNNILIDGWSKSERSEAPERALDILMRMEESFQKGGNGHVKPDNYSYTSCIDCFVKSNRPRSGQHAVQLLKRMKKLHLEHGGDPPSTDCYNAVLNGLAAARSKESADLAMSILSEMEAKSAQDSNNGVVPAPNRVTYNTCLKACRNGHDEYALIAEELLLRMTTAAQDGKNSLLAPDSYTYAAVINVLGRSDNVDKAERVLRILNQMALTYQSTLTESTNGNKVPSLSGLKPTTHVFNAALNACAFSRYDINAKMDAFVITVSIMVMLQKYVTADEVTYGTVLRACSNLLPRSDPRRDELVHKIFSKARKEGHVSDMVLTQLKFAASAPLLQELVGIRKDLEVTIDDLPSDWTRRVKRRRKVNRWT
jgi:pentatricopeptide repeat protein